MDIETALISKIVETEDLGPVINNKITGDFFYTSSKPVFEYILKHYREYRKVPSYDVLKAEFKDLELENYDEPVDFFIDKVRENHKNNLIKKGIRNIITKMEEEESGAAEKELYKLTSKISTEIRVSKDINYADDVEERINRYLEKKKFLGIDGIPIGLEPVDMMTGGGHGGELITILGMPETGKCVSEDTKIIVPNGGLITIREFVEREEKQVYALNQLSGKMEVADIKETIDDGKKEVFNVELRDGRFVEVTGSHPFLTVDGWKNIKELKEGDFVGVPEKINCFGTVKPDDDYIKMMAYLIAEGGLTKGHVTFTNTDLEIIEDFKRICNRYGVTTTISKGDSNTLSLKGYGLGKNSRNIVRLLIDDWGLTFKKSSEKELPNEVFNYCEESIRLLIGILWSCDGYISKKGDNLSCSFGVSSEKLADQVFHLLHKLGFNPKYRKREKIPCYEVTMTHSDEIEKFIKDIPLIGEKRRRVSQYNKFKKGKSYKLIPLTKRIIEIVDKKRKELGFTRNKVSTLINTNFYSGRERISDKNLMKIAEFFDIPELKTLAESEIRWVKVKSIKSQGHKQVYDLAVNYPYNNFVANDIIVHNTWAEVVISRTAIRDNYRVLFITKEMEPEQIVARMDAILLGFPFEGIKRGILGDEKEKEYFEKLKEAKGIYDNFIVSADDGEGGVTDIQMKVEEHAPDMVVIDGSYLIKDEDGGKAMHERAMNITRRLKQLARKMEVPVYNSSQINRGVKRGSVPTMEDAAFTYAYAQDSDVIFTLYRTEEMKYGNKLGFRVEKVRDGPGGRNFILHWDFEDPLNFGILAEEAANEGSADNEEGVIF